MRLCMATPWACAWCSHGHVHGIATSKRVVYLPRGYTIGKHAPPHPLSPKEHISLSILSSQSKVQAKVNRVVLEQTLENCQRSSDDTNMKFYIRNIYDATIKPNKCIQCDYALRGGLQNFKSGQTLPSPLVAFLPV